jgi:hypothetical protein
LCAEHVRPGRPRYPVLVQQAARRVEFATLEWVDWFNNRRLFGARRLASGDTSKIAQTVVTHERRLLS